CMQAIVPVASCASAWSMRNAISCPGTSSPRSRWSSRIVRASEAIAKEYSSPGLVPQERADALDRLEVAALAQRPHGAAVRECLMHGEVEPVAALLHPGPVEWARASLEAEAPAGGTLPRGPLGAGLEE